jgi:hypothetical protein
MAPASRRLTTHQHLPRQVAAESGARTACS